MKDRRHKAPIPQLTISNGFKRMMKIIGITTEVQTTRNLVFHRLRYTFVSLSRASGIPAFIVQKMAGHSTMGMTNNYSHSEGIFDFAAYRIQMVEALKKVSSK